MEPKRQNNIGPLRLAFALMILVGHSVGHTGGPELLRYPLLILGLQGFFYLSGYLVTESSRRWTFPKFALRRVMRLWPAFVVAMLGWGLVYGMPPLIDTLTMGHQPWILPARTLRWEMGCYAIDAAFWYLGVARDRRVVMGLAVLATIWFLALPGFGIPADNLYGMFRSAAPRFTVAFLWGSTTWLYRAEIVRSKWIALACVAVLAATLPFENAFWIGGVLAGPYLYHYLAQWTRPVIQWTNRTDLVYGIYLHHWPMLGVVLPFFQHKLAWWQAAPIVLALCLPLAVASWFLIEKPSRDLVWRLQGGRTIPTPPRAVAESA